MARPDFDAECRPISDLSGPEIAVFELVQGEARVEDLSFTGSAEELVDQIRQLAGGKAGNRALTDQLCRIYLGELLSRRASADTIRACRPALRCITQFADGIVPGIGHDDFSRPRLPGGEADPVLLEQCLVQESQSAAWQGAGARELPVTLFRQVRRAEAELADLCPVHDAAFLVAAINLGFILAREHHA